MSAARQLRRRLLPIDPRDAATPTIAVTRAACGCCVTFYCQYCERQHTHGAGDGLRVAHCDEMSSPYRVAGYRLREVQP